MTQLLSPQKQKILDLLLRATKPLSAYDILAKLQKKGIHSPPTVYRALDDLMKRGLVHRLETKGAFIACRHEHEAEKSHPSPFAICTACGKIEEMENVALDATLTKAIAPFLAQTSKKVLEIEGICHACLDKRG